MKRGKYSGFSGTGNRLKQEGKRSFAVSVRRTDSWGKKTGHSGFRKIYPGDEVGLSVG